MKVVTKAEVQDDFDNNTLDFNDIKVVVHTANFDKICKTKNGVPVIGDMDYCRNYMISRFALNPKAGITLRNVLLITTNEEVLLGNLTI